MRSDDKPLVGAPYTEPCVACGKTETTRWLNAKDLIARGMCFDCSYWQERVEKVGNETQAVIAGIVYQIVDENKSVFGSRGHGGREFIIKFNDGREVTTTNLWYNGPVPMRFKAKILDNAVFIKK